MEYFDVPVLVGAPEVTMKVIHVITGLKDGGAEGALYRLICSDKINTHIVISLTDRGKYGSLIEEIGCDVFYLNMKLKSLPFGCFLFLIKLLKNNNPDVVQTWMYHADLIGGIAAKLAGIKKIFWGVRHSNLDKNKTSLKTQIIARSCSWFSYIVPEKIVCCASRAVVTHLSVGYKDNFTVIPNGYELKEVSEADTFRGDGATLNIPDGTPIIGMVARYNYQKDHSNLIKALSILNNKGSNFYCVLVGEDMDESNSIILDEIQNRGLNDKVSLLGQRNDIPNIMSSLDLHILSSSSGEAFPNVVAEAMLYKTPCIVTDVGDAAFIVDKFGWVVNPGDAQLLASSIEEALKERELNSKAWQARIHAGQARIMNNFSMEAMVKNYHEVWGI